MKCTIIFGSLRKDGNTIKLLDIVTRELVRTEVSKNAAVSKGTTVIIERFDVYDSSIAGCRACLGCQSRTSEVC